VIDGNHNRLASYAEAETSSSPLQSDLPQQSLLHILWRRRWIVLLVTFASLAAAIIYLFNAVPGYTSSSRLYVEQSGPRILKDDQGVITQSDTYLYTQAELLKSTPIVADAAEKAQADKMKSLAGIDNPVAYLKSVFNVEVGKKDEIITVSCTTRFPDEAAQLVNSVVDAYITYHSKRQRSTAAEVLKILQKEKDRRDIELAVKTKAMVNFKKANGALSFESDKTNIITQRLARLSDALTEAQLKAIDVKATYETTASAIKDPAQLRQIVEAQYLSKGMSVYLEQQDRALQTDLARLELQLSLARKQGLGDDHRIVENLRIAADQIRERMNNQDARFAEAYAAASLQNLLTARQRESEIQKSFDQQQKAALDLNVNVAEHAALESDWKRTERICEILDSRIKELNVTEDSGALNINILEVARPPSFPSQPNHTRILAMALMLGVLLGAAFAIARDWLDQRLRSAEEIAAVLNVPVLGVIPHISGKRSPVVRGQAMRLAPSSDVAEAYRTVRTAIYFGIPDGHAKTLLVTSPAPGDGKTTLASNLAIAMAQAGQRILLIDGDFRRPMQHRVFEIPDNVGLSSTLAGRTPLNDAIKPTTTPNLHLLPCGPLPPNPSEMLNSAVFAELLKQLSTRYEHIIIDSPPVMPVADARILGAICDVTLLVLRAEKSTRKLAEHSRDSLLSVGASILGVIVNDVSHGKSRYGYYSQYGYYRRDHHHNKDSNGNRNRNDSSQSPEHATIS